MTSVQYQNAANETVTLELASLITNITVSASRKLSDGDYGSYDSFQSLTATVPLNTPQHAIEQIGNELFTMCESAVADRLALMQVRPEDRRTYDPADYADKVNDDEEEWQEYAGGVPTKAEMLEDFRPKPTPELDKTFGKREEQQASGQGDEEYPFTERAPGASQCKPNQKYSSDAVSYRLDESIGKVKFYQPNGQWPMADIKYPSVFFDTAFGLQWKPKPTKAADHIPLAAPLRLFIECSGPDNLTKIVQGKGGNPYRNIKKAVSQD